MNLQAVVILWLLAGVSGNATGSYPYHTSLIFGAGDPELFDAERYNYGKNIIAGRVLLAEGVKDSEDSDTQLNILKSFNDKLPASVRDSFNVEALAGRLSANSLEAVTYFLTIRYKLDEKPRQPVLPPSRLSIPPPDASIQQRD